MPGLRGNRRRGVHTPRRAFGNPTGKPMLCCGVCQYEDRHCAHMAPPGAMRAHLEQYKQQGFDFAAFTPEELWSRLQGACAAMSITLLQCQEDFTFIWPAWQPQRSMQHCLACIDGRLRRRKLLPRNGSLLTAAADSLQAARCGSLATRRRGTGTTPPSASCVATQWTWCAAA